MAAKACVFVAIAAAGLGDREAVPDSAARHPLNNTNPYHRETIFGF